MFVMMQKIMPFSQINLRVTGQSSQGGRKYMEDAFVVAYQQTEDKKDLEYAFFGIFDGHGGKEAAQFAKNNLLDNIITSKKFWTNDDDDILCAIREGFLTTHLAMWKELENWPCTPTGLPSTAGTTASIAFIKKGKLYTGHVGDSRIVIGLQETGCDEWCAESLTLDHKPECPVEKQRILESGGMVMTKGGVERVVWKRPRTGHHGLTVRSTDFDRIPFLAVARSLGDLWSYNAAQQEFSVSPEPDLGVMQLDLSKDRCLLLASDGLWNAMSPQAAIQLVQSVEQENNKIIQDFGIDSALPLTFCNPSKMLVECGLRRWTQLGTRADNVSVVTVMLDPSPSSPQLREQLVLSMNHPGSLEVRDVCVWNSQQSLSSSQHISTNANFSHGSNENESNSSASENVPTLSKDETCSQSDFYASNSDSQSFTQNNNFPSKHSKDESMQSISLCRLNSHSGLYGNAGTIHNVDICHENKCLDAKNDNYYSTNDLKLEMSFESKLDQNNDIVNCESRNVQNVGKTLCKDLYGINDDCCDSYCIHKHFSHKFSKDSTKRDFAGCLASSSAKLNHCNDICCAKDCSKYFSSKERFSCRDKLSKCFKRTSPYITRDSNTEIHAHCFDSLDGAERSQANTSNLKQNFKSNHARLSSDAHFTKDVLVDGFNNSAKMTDGSNCDVENFKTNFDLCYPGDFTIDVQPGDFDLNDSDNDNCYAKGYSKGSRNTTRGARKTNPCPFDVQVNDKDIYSTRCHMNSVIENSDSNSAKDLTKRVNSHPFVKQNDNSDFSEHCHVRRCVKEEDSDSPSSRGFAKKTHNRFDLHNHGKDVHSDGCRAECFQECMERDNTTKALTDCLDLGDNKSNLTTNDDEALFSSRCFSDSSRNPSLRYHFKLDLKDSQSVPDGVNNSFETFHADFEKGISINHLHSKNRNERSKVHLSDKIHSKGHCCESTNDITEQVSPYISYKDGNKISETDYCSIRNPSRGCTIRPSDKRNLKENSSDHYNKSCSSVQNSCISGCHIKDASPTKQGQTANNLKTVGNSLMDCFESYCEDYDCLDTIEDECDCRECCTRRDFEFRPMVVPRWGENATGRTSLSKLATWSRFITHRHFQDSSDSEDSEEAHFIPLPAAWRGVDIEKSLCGDNSSDSTSSSGIRHGKQEDAASVEAASDCESKMLFLKDQSESAASSTNCVKSKFFGSKCLNADPLSGLRLAIKRKYPGTEVSSSYICSSMNNDYLSERDYMKKHGIS